MNRSGRGPFIHEIFEMKRLPVEQRRVSLPVRQARVSKLEDCLLSNATFCCPFARQDLSILFVIGRLKWIDIEGGEVNVWANNIAPIVVTGACLEGR